MTAAERDLIERLATALDARMTKSGHLAQIVSHEHLGVRSWKGCGKPCLAARLLLIEAAEHLTGERAPGPPATVQGELFGQEAAG